MEAFSVLIYIVFLVLYIYLLVKFVTLCNDARDIKNILIHIEQHLNTSTNERGLVSSEKFKTDDLVVEKKTQKQLRLYEKAANGEWVCYSGGLYYKTLKEDEIISWEKFLETK